ncbi:hypothetical protein BpHYR1_053580 [Brachionus plicatilis]|uniref:Uncharacterized protein n=1 Tax=Brachionus plicatilis TaxID=10195 RepID=A0A3M7QYH5_BRAPC|nr:hypothetical protein BpHYR1_053580 [Brachionus plicatilis]
MNHCLKKNFFSDRSRLVYLLDCYNSDRSSSDGRTGRPAFSDGLLRSFRKTGPSNGLDRPFRTGLMKYYCTNEIIRKLIKNDLINKRIKKPHSVQDMHKIIINSSSRFRNHLNTPGLLKNS